jgi:hypothetical protein
MSWGLVLTVWILVSLLSGPVIGRMLGRTSDRLPQAQTRGRL